MTKKETKVSSIVRDRFTISARKAVKVAQEEAASYGQSHINPVHLLLGLMQVKGEAQGVLLEEGLTVERVRTVIEQFTVNLGPSPGPPLNLTPETQQVMKTAVEEAEKHRNRQLRSGHLLLGILALDHTSLMEVLDIHPDHIRELVEQSLQRPVTTADFRGRTGHQAALVEILEIKNAGCALSSLTLSLNVTRRSLTPCSLFSSHEPRFMHVNTARM